MSLCQHKQNCICLRNRRVVTFSFFFVCIFDISVTFERYFDLGLPYNHNFFVHYQIGGRQPIEDKPIRKTYLDENLQRLCITFSEHKNHYNFYDPREIVSEFLTVFENFFVPRADGSSSSVIYHNQSAAVSQVWFY